MTEQSFYSVKWNYYEFLKPKFGPNLSFMIMNNLFETEGQQASTKAQEAIDHLKTFCQV